LVISRGSEAQVIYTHVHTCGKANTV